MKNPIKALIQKNQQQGEGEITLGLWATGLTASTLNERHPDAGHASQLEINQSVA